MSARGKVGSLVLRASAKINLSLRVGPFRPDGFHDVRTLMQSIDLHDTLRLTPRAGPFELRSQSTEVPLDRTNLVWRAADLLWRTLGRSGEARDARVTIDKVIPVGAGLGGGSADAAATLAGLNRLWKGGLDRSQLILLAAELGSDVPFFLHGGTAVGAGRGEELYPVVDVAPLHLVIVKPSFAVLAADAYRWLDEDRSRAIGADSSNTAIAVGWSTGPVSLVNDLTAPVVRRHPEIAAAIERLQHEGAVAAAMSGSGSAVFGVFSARTARRAARALRQSAWRVLLSRTLSRREACRRLRLC